MGLVISSINLNRSGKTKFENKSYLKAMDECLSIHLCQIFQTCNQVSAFLLAEDLLLPQAVASRKTGNHGGHTTHLKPPKSKHRS